MPGAGRGVTTRDRLAEEQAAHAFSRLPTPTRVPLGEHSAGAHYHVSYRRMSGSRVISGAADLAPTARFVVGCSFRLLEFRQLAWMGSGHRRMVSGIGQDAEWSRHRGR